MLREIARLMILRSKLRDWVSAAGTRAIEPKPRWKPQDGCAGAGPHTIGEWPAVAPRGAVTPFALGRPERPASTSGDSA
jgi:hypothetical protein